MVLPGTLVLGPDTEMFFGCICDGGSGLNGVTAPPGKSSVCMLLATLPAVCRGVAGVESDWA